MKFYIAGRFSDEPSRILIQESIAALEKLGHTCTFNWTVGPTCKPYEENVELTRESAVLAAKGALECELFIMVSYPGGTGMYVEYGIALAEQLRKGSPKMYIIGDHKSFSIFNYHPAVKWADNLEGVLADLV